MHERVCDRRSRSCRLSCVVRYATYLINTALNSVVIKHCSVLHSHLYPLSLALSHQASRSTALSFTPSWPLKNSSPVLPSILGSATATFFFSIVHHVVHCIPDAIHDLCHIPHERFRPEKRPPRATHWDLATTVNSHNLALPGTHPGQSMG